MVSVDNKHKFCSKCCQQLRIENFCKDKNSKDGHYHYCKICHSKRILGSYHKEPEKHKIRTKKYYQQNIEKYKNYNKEYNAKNSKILSKKKLAYANEKYKNNINYRITCLLRFRLRNALGTKITKSKKTLELLGCTVQELRVHLESQFTTGMTWENQGKWHIDHKIPCSSFDLTKESEQLKCFHFSNLQPLWAIDNLQKGDKI